MYCIVFRLSNTFICLVCELHTDSKIFVITVITVFTGLKLACLSDVLKWSESHCESCFVCGKTSARWELLDA